MSGRRPLKLYSATDFQALVQKGEHPDDAKIQKAYTADITKAASGPTFQFIVSTAAPDRDHDVIRAEGWDLTEFKKNNGVMWAHDYKQPPVGKATSIGVAAGQLKASVEFTPKEMYPFGDMIRQMVEHGYLHATSVGFAPIDYAFDETRKGMTYTKQSLLEFSIVPIPANPECLIEARSVGIDLAPYRAWAEKALDSYHGEEVVAIPKSAIERVYAMLKTETKGRKKKAEAMMAPSDLIEAKEEEAKVDAVEKDADDPILADAAADATGFEDTPAAAPADTEVVKAEVEDAAATEEVEKAKLECPRGKECPLKPYQAAEHCPQGRDCPLTGALAATGNLLPTWQPNGPTAEHDVAAQKMIDHMKEWTEARLVQLTEKSGREFSAANKTAIRKVHEHITNAHASMTDLVAKMDAPEQVPTQEPEDAMDRTCYGAGAAAGLELEDATTKELLDAAETIDAIVIELADEVVKANELYIDKDDLAAALMQSIAETVKEMAEGEMARALRKARGLVD